MVKNPKRLERRVSGGKHARAVVDPGSLKPLFTWRDAVDDGPHGRWSDLPFSELKAIIVRLEELEKITRAELRDLGNHACRNEAGVSREIIAALKRMGEYENIENLWSFRLGKNIARVWALWIPPLTRVLWIDPDHRGYVPKDFR